MARRFVLENSQYLTVPFYGVVTYPFTLAVWFKPSVSSANRSIFGFYAAASTCFINIYLHYLKVYGWVYDAGSRSGDSSCATASVVNTWNLASYVCNSSTSRVPWLNNISGTENTTSSYNFSPIDRVSVGAIKWGSMFYCGETLAHAAYWNKALTSADINLMFSGVSPDRIYPNSLLGYWPLNGTTWEREKQGRYNLIPSTSIPTWAPDPPQVKPIRKNFWSRYLGMAPGGNKNRMIICNA